jgi:hypothetical protein
MTTYFIHADSAFLGWIVILVIFLCIIHCVEENKELEMFCAFALMMTMCLLTAIFYALDKQTNEFKEKSENICSYLSLEKDSCSLKINFKTDTEDEVIQVNLKVSKKEKCYNAVFLLKQGILTDTGYKCDKTLTIVLLEDRKIDALRLFDKTQIDEILSSKKDIIKEKYLEYFNIQ